MLRKFTYENNMATGKNSARQKGIERRKKRREKGLCLICNRKAVKNRTNCDYHIRYQKKWYRRSISKKHKTQ